MADDSGVHEDEKDSTGSSSQPHSELEEDSDEELAALRGLTPAAVENLVRSVRSHELFPFFEDAEIGSSEHHAGKSEFGASPHDILRWNKWLDVHGAPSFALLIEAVKISRVPARVVGNVLFQLRQLQGRSLQLSA